MCSVHYTVHTQYTVHHLLIFILWIFLLSLEAETMVYRDIKNSGKKYSISLLKQCLSFCGLSHGRSRKKCVFGIRLVNKQKNKHVKAKNVTI